jgi:uncharacterized membrane protein YdjX (TVP38/TMEM64 family)
MLKKNIAVKNSEKKGKCLFISVYFILTLGCLIFSVLAIYNARNLFLQKNALLLSVLSGTAFFLLYAVFVWSIYREKQLIYKSLLSVVICLLFALVICFILQKTGFFQVIADENALQEYLSRTGAWMPIIYTVLQYLQVVILPIPSIVSTLAGVALFGAYKTILYSLIGILLGSYTAFFIGRKLGNKAVAWLIGEETLARWQKKLKGKDNFFLTVMFLLPLFPDDVLCFLAGLSSMTSVYFLVMIFISRILAISATCLSIDFIPFNTWWGILIWGVLIIAVILGFWLVYKNLESIQVWFKENVTGKYSKKSKKNK